MADVLNPIAELSEEYDQNEVDHDRVPTSDGFVWWLVGEVTRARDDTRQADALAALAEWADARLADECVDRQLIAEYLTDALFALSSGEQPEPPSF